MKDLDNLQILIVEDDKNLQSYYSGMIDYLGIKRDNVYQATSVAAALEMLDHMDFDGALLDMVLGDGVGLQVGKRCVDKKIPVVFITGVDDDFNYLMMYGLGWIIKKPAPIVAVKRALKYFSECSCEC